MDTVDVAVVGGGFGGLSAALELAARGYSVTLCERLAYPGGCASTFKRGGHHFETGATLFAGFSEGQTMARIVEAHQLDVQVRLLDPVIEFRTNRVELEVSSDRDTLHNALVARAENPDGARRALQMQTKVADSLWYLLDHPEVLPPLSLEAIATHLGRIGRYAGLLRWAGRPMRSFLAAYGLENDAMMRAWWDATSQITVQASSEHADTLFALGASDYFLRGAAHVVGGIGQLADAMVEAIRRNGGSVSLADEVKVLRPDSGGWVVESRRGECRASHVVSAILPAQTAKLLGTLPRGLRKASEAVRDGWSAAMLYRVIEDAPELPRGPFHLELVDDDGLSFTEGNHVFCSVAGAEETAARGHAGQRTVTLSTHIAMKPFLALDEAGRAEVTDRIHETMRATVRRRGPELASPLIELTASPRTWRRFTGRTEGFVGGVPRRAGLAHYFDIGPTSVAPGLWLVGDSVFPGQSVLATVIGGSRTAAAIAARVETGHH